MKILDSTASNRSMWYQKNNPFTVFLDKRKMREYARETGSHIKILPDVQAVWQNLPFRNESFDMVIFDPPHIIKNKNTTPPMVSKRYGFLNSCSWREEITKGTLEMFRVLKTGGCFILKWSGRDTPVEEVLKLIPYSPMFGTRTGQKNNTHWICFLKYNPNASLDNWIA